MAKLLEPASPARSAAAGTPAGGRKAFAVPNVIIPQRTPRSDAIVIQRYSGAAAAAYAKRWALRTNPKYPRFTNDCTNFTSQAMLAGGWTMVGGSFWDRKDNDVWWYGRSSLSRASYTWAGAHNFTRFVTASGRGTLAAKVMDLGIGDVLTIAFNGSHVGHAMVVTGKTSTDLLLSYHTSDHLDEPYFAPGGIRDRTRRAHPSYSLFGYKL